MLWLNAPLMQVFCWWWLRVIALFRCRLAMLCNRTCNLVIASGFKEVFSVSFFFFFLLCLIVVQSFLHWKKIHLFYTLTGFCRVWSLLKFDIKICSVGSFHVSLKTGFCVKGQSTSFKKVLSELSVACCSTVWVLHAGHRADFCLFKR